MIATLKKIGSKMAGKSEQDEENKWLKLLRNPTATLLIGILLASGGWRVVVPYFFPQQNTHDDMSMPQVPVYARAMDDMRDSLIALKVTVDEQGKHMDRLESKIERMNDRLLDLRTHR